MNWFPNRGDQFKEGCKDICPHIPYNMHRLTVEYLLVFGSSFIFVQSIDRLASVTDPAHFACIGRKYKYFAW